MPAAIFESKSPNSAKLVRELTVAEKTGFFIARRVTAHQNSKKSGF
ncbi:MULTISPECIES: hypothetical protein [unclassified Microcoleus]